MDAEDSTVTLTAMRHRFPALLSLLIFLIALPAHAHIGSPDVYVEGNAGPYKLFVVVRPPLVIPGVAEVEVRSQTSGIDRIQIAPIPLTGEASKHPPVPDVMQKPSSDAQYFTGHLWIMATGSWQIRFTVNGAQGSGVFSVPLPATAMGTKKMQPAMGVFLAILGILLIIGMVGIVGAAVRESQLTSGAQVTPVRRRRGYAAMTATLALLVTAVILGNAWWKADATSYAGNVYKPLQMQAGLRPGNVLDLKLSDPGWLKQRTLDDFILDHNHLMHLYMLRWPAMDVVYHLHPQPVATGDFQLALPSMPAGNYRLYADVVHANGFPETMTAAVTLPDTSGRPLAGDDAEGTSLGLKPTGDASLTGSRYRLPDGYTMVWKRPDTLAPRQPIEFTFELLDANGQPPKDMGLYMGMVGHAAFVKSDGTVFAHIHPSGTASMAALMMAQAENGPQAAQQEMSSMPGMSGMDMSGSPVSNIVSFPYGFPASGTYRIFIQMKHGDVVETGAFDAVVAAPGKAD